jgi:DNA-binding HxlR family transcriptional regulator
MNGWAILSRARRFVPVQQVEWRPDRTDGRPVKTLSRMHFPYARMTHRNFRATLSVPAGEQALLRNKSRPKAAMAGQSEKSYGQFCPVAMAAEIFCSRWSPQQLHEMICGSARFNDIRRGLPRISPTLLSKRLKELEKAGLIAERKTGGRGTAEYKLTDAGEDLRDVIVSLGVWGHRWIESSLSLKNLDPSLLMWDMRRHLVPTSLPKHRCTMKFIYPEISAGRKTWWVLIEKNQVDVCAVDPGYEIDLLVRSSLRSMTSVWMGMTTLKSEIDAGNIELSGDRAIARSMHEWLGLSPFAKERRYAS